MPIKLVVVQYQNKRKKNGKQATSLIEYAAEDYQDNAYIIGDILIAMQNQGEPCSKCFVIVK